jgi:DNA-binding MarR family transcriptional regulator
MAKEKDKDLSPEESLRALARLARRMRGLGHDGGLNPAQWEALRYLAHVDEARRNPGEMARYLGATKGTTSQTVASLEKKGLIAKLQHASDSRSMVLALTAEGVAKLQADPLLKVLEAISSLKPKTRRRFDRAIAALLESGALG